MIIRLRNEQQKETAQAKQQVQNQQNTSMPTTTTSTTTATTTASSIQTTSTKQSPSLPVQMTEQTTSAEQKDPYDCSTEEEDSDNDGDGTSSSVIKVDNKNDCIDESNKGMFSMYIPRISSYLSSYHFYKYSLFIFVSLLPSIPNNIYLS